MIKILRFSCDLVRISGLNLIVEFIADAPDGQDVFRRVRVWFYLLAQFSYKCHDVTVIKQIVTFPDSLINLFFGKYLTAVSG